MTQRVRAIPFDRSVDNGFSAKGPSVLSKRTSAPINTKAEGNPRRADPKAPPVTRKQDLNVR